MLYLDYKCGRAQAYNLIKILITTDYNVPQIWQHDFCQSLSKHARALNTVNKV